MGILCIMFVYKCMSSCAYVYISSRISNMLSIYRENDKVQRKARLINLLSREDIVEGFLLKIVTMQFVTHY